MTEGLFLITTLFVAYVVYVILNEKKASSAGKAPAATETPATASTEQVTAVAAEEKPKTASTRAKPAASKAAAKPAAAKKPAPAAAKAEPETLKGSGLKDPKTGEVATTYTNYRFTKRWIKEALVAEGLVEKVFKNDELNAEIETKIKAGLAKLEGMKKYKP